MKNKIIIFTISILFIFYGCGNSNNNQVAQEISSNTQLESIEERESAPNTENNSPNYEINNNLQTQSELKGNLQITSDIEEIEVYIDENYKGETPILVRGLNTGEHIITIKKASYSDCTFSEYINEGYNTLAVSLNQCIHISKIGLRIPGEFGMVILKPGESVSEICNNEIKLIDVNNHDAILDVGGVRGIISQYEQGEINQCEILVGDIINNNPMDKSIVIHPRL